jgi:hypothetical protein
MQPNWKHLIKTQFLQRIKWCPAKQCYCRYSRPPYCLVQFKDCPYYSQRRTNDDTI